MPSSFSRFSEHPDEQRMDSKEGRTFLVHRTGLNGGQTLVIEMAFGHDTYVLCGSTLPSVDLMNAFGADSAIIIKDPAGFANCIAKALGETFSRGFDGPCSYQLRRIIEHDLGWLNLPTEETDDISKFDKDVLDNAIQKLASADVYFLKRAIHVAQAEWRFVWIMNHNIQSNIILKVPESRQFCERWDDQGDVVAFGKDRI